MDILQDERVMVPLRELRLWHWRQVLRFRTLQCDYEARQSAGQIFMVGKRIREYKKLANHHLNAVITLNSFFEIGDTAEQDHMKIDHNT